MSLEIELDTDLDITSDEVPLKLTAVCDECGGDGKICTFRGYINSSEDTYERCDACKGKGTLFIFKEILLLKAFPNYMYWKNKAETLQEDIKELLIKGESK